VLALVVLALSNALQARNPRSCQLPPKKKSLFLIIKYFCDLVCHEFIARWTGGPHCGLPPQDLTLLHLSQVDNLKKKINEIRSAARWRAEGAQSTSRRPPPGSEIESVAHKVTCRTQCRPEADSGPLVCFRPDLLAWCPFVTKNSFLFLVEPLIISLVLIYIRSVNEAALRLPRMSGWLTLEKLMSCGKTFFASF